MVESLEKIIAKEKNDINSHLTKEGSEILNVLTYFSNDDINYLKHLINENKRKNGGLPTGEIIFKNIDIPFDLIFRNFPYLKNNYEDALKEQNPKDKDNKFEKANNKLINCILFLINGIRKSENKVQINGQNSNIENFNIENFKSLLSSRDNVAYQIYRIRLNSNNNLTGNIELRRGVSIDLSDNKFTTIINEYQQAYIKSKDEKTKAKLDTKLAERLILEEGLIIQINNPLLSLHDSNYKDKRKLATNLRACKQGLENIGISTNAIKITHNGEMFYAVEKKDSTKKTKEENEILGKPTINDIYTDSSEGQEKFIELLTNKKNGLKVEVNEDDSNNWKEVTINQDDKNILTMLAGWSSKKYRILDNENNEYHLQIRDKSIKDETVWGPIDEFNPGNYFYYLKKSDNNSGDTGDETDGDETDGDENGGDENGGDENGGDENGGDENGGDENGGDENGGDENGGDENGGDENGGDENGGDENGGDENGGDENGGDENGGDENGGDENGGDENDNITIDAALSDSTEVYTDHVGRNIDEALNRFYNKFSWKSNFTKKLQFFLFRGYIKNKKVKERLDVMKRTPFTLNKDYDSEMANLVNRHDLEEKAFGDTERGVFGKIERTNLLTEKPELQTELKNLCKLYILGNIDESSFKNKFNEFVKNSFSLPKDKQFVSTNILDKLNQYRNNVELLINMGKELKSYQNDNNNTHFENIKKWVVDVINSYTKNERFKKDLESLYKDISSNNNLEERIGRFIKHQEALTKMSIDNMQLKLDMLSGGKGAYQINNKDNEDVFYKLGDWLDNHRFLGPLVSAGAIFGVGVTAGIFLGLPAGVLGSAVVGAKLAVKKKTHATKEQHNQEGQISTDSERALKTIKEYERILTTNDGEIINTLPELTKNRKNFKYSESEDYVTGKNGKKHKIKYNLATRYRALRQIQLYRDSIQSKLLEDDSDTKNIITIINSFNKSDGAANNNMKYFILDSYARLEAYLQTGHNFFKSKNSKEIETDFYNLELCLNSAAEKLFGPGKTFRDIKDLEAEDKDGNQIVFDDLVKGYISDYQTAKNKFKKEKRELSLKYFIGGALTSAGISHLLGGITDNLFDNNPTGTLGEPEVHEKIIENFDSGSFILPDGNEILDNAINDFQDLTNNDVVTLHFGSGTDIRPVRPDSILTKPETYLGKLQELTNLINESSFSNKEDLINQVSGWNNGFNTAGQRFTNDILHDCRCLDVVINTIKGANTDHFDGVLNLHYDIELDNPGTKLGEQFRTGAGKLEIRHFIPGEEGGKWTKYFRPLGSLISVFSNTFTRKPEEDDKPKKGGPKPVDPKKNPDDVHKDDEPKPEDVGKKVGEVKGIVTRGQMINKIDDTDLGIEYPGDGKMLTPMQAATNLILCHREGNTPSQRKRKFSQEDIDALSSMSNRNDQITYLMTQIEEDRAKVEKSEEQQALNKMLLEIEKDLPRHLKDIFGEDYKYFNTPMSKDRIHLVDDRDFLAMDCNSKDGTLGVFRSKEGDIYISQSFLEESGGLNGRIIYSEPDPDGISTITYPELYFNIIHTVVHEMIHSMSAINYFDTKKGGNKSDYFPRRVGLKRVKITKAGELSAVDGGGFNEAATESLAWEIVSRWHKPYNNPRLKVYMCYKDYINIIEQMEKIDGVKKLDFWKAMLIRKRSENPDSVEKNTPLFELVKKINGNDRPKYYDLIMNSMDKGIDSDHIVQFIKTKNIKYLKNGLPFDKVLSDVFDKNLLTKNGLDFKKEILDVYPRS